MKRVLYEPTIILTAASAAFSIIGGIAQGSAQREQGESEARYLAQQAEQERVALSRDLSDADRESARNLARSRAVLAAQGGDTTTGGALDLLSTQEGVYGEQRQRLISDSDARIRGLNMRADSARRAGASAQFGSVFSGFGKGLSTGLSLFNRADRAPSASPTSMRRDPTRGP